LSQLERENFIGKLLPGNSPLPQGSPPYPAFILSYIARQEVALIYQILGYENDHEVNETILGLLSSFCVVDTITLVKCDYAKYLDGAINYQISTYPTAKYFRYQSYLLHLIMFNNV
jgi:hypothetical protein